MLGRVREAIFNRLAPWLVEGEGGEGARVLDLFAGSGSLGLEALSRGAGFVRFVEQGAAAQEVLRGNLAAFELEAKSEVLGVDALAPRAAEPGARRWDVAFYDPPYPLLDAAPTRTKLLRVARRVILGDDEVAPALADDGVFVFHAPAGKLGEVDFGAGLEVAERTWGTTTIWFLGRGEG